MEYNTDKLLRKISDLCFTMQHEFFLPHNFEVSIRDILNETFDKLDNLHFDLEDDEDIARRGAESSYYDNCIKESKERR